MKFNMIVYFSIILILLIPVNAFADSVNLSVDLPIFTDNDKIVIYGNVSTETALQVIITDSDEIIILNQTIIIPVGDFTYDMIIGDYELNRSGHYNISVIHGESKIMEQFFYDSEHNVNPMKVDNTLESFTESEMIIVFTVALSLIHI